MRAHDDAGDRAGQLLPIRIDQQHGAVAEDDLAAVIASHVSCFLPTSRCVVRSHRRTLSPARDRLGEEPRDVVPWEACSADFE